MPVFEDAIPELKGGAPGAPGGFPTGFPGDVPPGEFFPGEFFPEEFGFPGGGFPGDVQEPKPAPKETDAKSGRRSVNAGSRKVDMGEGVKTDAQFTYLDFNLDPNKTYSYRIKSFGLSANLIEIESAWSEPLVAKTEQDKSMRFVKYIPGLRNKEGKLIKKSDGTYVSPDKAYIAVSQLFDPPWSPQRYFIEYEHKGIIPGVEGSDGIGREVANYNVLTADGNPVYFDGVNKFLYVHSTINESQVEQELKANPKVWKRYRIERDFTLAWKVVSITEEIKEEEVVKEAFDAAGRPVEKVEVNKTYHYYAELVNRVTKETDRIELERDNPKVRILKF
jgi:metal-sulfur cluster biosynthetic enzyme